MRKWLGYYFVFLLGLATSASAQEMEYYRLQSGTGFFASRDYIVTNAHVVKGCEKVNINGPLEQSELDVVATDDVMDLALIRAATPSEEFAPLRMDIDELKVGDDLVLVGFPGEKGVRGQYDVAKAQVKRLKYDDRGQTWLMFISDVIRQGNSGGPVLDTSGNVIGVVVGRMQFKTMNRISNETLAEEEFGAVITLRTLQKFVTEHGVYVQWNTSGLYMYGPEVLIDRARNYVVHVYCKQRVDGPPPEHYLEGEPSS